MANDFTVADVLEWARTKPADERYDFTSSDECAVAQFGLATGRAYLVGITAEEMIAIDPALEEAVNPGARFCDNLEPTFGALVTRLETLVQETPAKPSPWLNPQTYLDADCGENVW